MIIDILSHKIEAINNDMPFFIIPANKYVSLLRVLSDNLNNMYLI